MGGKWCVGEQLGSGSFGAVFAATCGGQPDARYALKLETRASRSQLRYEVRVYRQLAGVRGLPRIYDSGVDRDFNYLVMQHAGESLYDVMKRHRGRLPHRSTMVIGCQAIQRLHDIHARGLLHRDLKPQNLTLSEGTVFLCDFGLAKAYLDEHREHVVWRNGKRLTGTPRFASIHTHDGVEQSRRDDIESLVYVLVYLVRGELPWQGLKRRKGERKHDAIAEVKRATSPETLCEGLPALRAILSSARRLGFDETPAYQYYVACLRSEIESGSEGPEK